MSRIFCMRNLPSSSRDTGNNVQKRVSRTKESGKAFTSALNDSAGHLQDDVHSNRALESLLGGLVCSTVVNPGPMSTTNGISRNIINIAVLIVLV